MGREERGRGVRKGEIETEEGREGVKERERGGGERQTEREREREGGGKRDRERETDRQTEFVCLLLACLTSQQQVVYLRDGSAQTILRAATLR